MMQRTIVKVDPFVDTLKSQHTKDSYKLHREYFLSTNPPSDSAALTDHIAGYLKGMEENGNAFLYRNVAFSAIKHHYTTTDKKLLDWDYIKGYLGEKNSTGKKRGYKPEHIRKLLDVSDVTDKAKVFLLLCGLRREALANIKLEDMHEIDGRYQITIYKGSDFEQVAFTTREATRAVNAYIEKMKPEFWLFPARQLRDKKTGRVRADVKGAHINVQVITNRLIHLAELAGLRSSSGNRAHREEVSAVHGLRHFAINAMKKARVDSEKRKLLLGHSIGRTQEAYDETMTDEDLFNDLKEAFMKAEPYLTVYDKVVVSDTDKDKQIATMQRQIEELTRFVEGIKAMHDEIK